MTGKCYKLRRVPNIFDSLNTIRGEALHAMMRYRLPAMPA